MRYLSITCPQRALRLFSSVQHTLKRQTPPSSLKRREFDVFKPHKYTVSCGDPVTFLGKFLRKRVLGVHGFSGSRKNSKGRKIMTF